jgi:WhiB family transcriptional regulator, redox-sensing transcriptional regulator
MAPQAVRAPTPRITTHLAGSGAGSGVVSRVLLHRPEWQEDALCREHPEVSWFPAKGKETAPARAVCQACLVRRECLDYALGVQDGDDFGNWGGTSRLQRRRIRRSSIDAWEWLERFG